MFDKRRLLFIPATLLLLASCSSEEPQQQQALPYGPVLTIIAQNADSIFHGYYLGMTPQEAKARKGNNDSLSMEEPLYQLYEGIISDQKEYTLECQFDEMGLFQLSLDVYLKDENNADSLFNDFTRYFNAKYGKAEFSGDVFTWEIPGKRPGRIEMLQEFDYGHGKFALYVFDTNFEGQEPVEGLLPN